MIAFATSFFSNYLSFLFSKVVSNTLKIRFYRICLMIEWLDITLSISRYFPYLFENKKNLRLLRDQYKNFLFIFVGVRNSKCVEETFYYKRSYLQNFLPDEVLLKICLYAAPCDLGRLSCTCKRIREVSLDPTLW